MSLVEECIGDDDLLRFVSGAFDDARAAEIRAHVDQCDDCRELLAIAGKEAAAIDTAGPAAKEPDDASVTIGQDLKGRFRIEREIGRGGMGVVYAATDLSLHSRVAVKVLKGANGDNDEAVHRFLRETRVASTLASPHAVRVVESGRLRSGAPFMVMELLEGKNLERVLTEDGELDVSVAVRWVVQACHAIGEAHAAGIVHRDVTLANLFLADASPEPIVKVLDFGLAKSSVSAPKQTLLTRADAMMGTPMYMSPEQLASSRDVDARTDVWALGVVLYRLVTAKFPFEGAHLLALLARMMRDAPAPPTMHRPDLAPEVEAVILRCLSRNLADRYANANEVGAALRQAIEVAEPVTRPVAQPAKRPAPLATTLVMGTAETLPLRGSAPSYPDTAMRPSAPSHPGYVPPSLPAPTPAAARWWLAVVAAAALVMSMLAFKAFMRRPQADAPEPPPSASPAAVEAPADPSPPPAEPAAAPPPSPPLVQTAATDDPALHPATDPRPRGATLPPRRGPRPLPTKTDSRTVPPAASSNGRLYEKM